MAAVHPAAAGGTARDIFVAIGAWMDWLAVQGVSQATMRSYGDSVLRAGRIARKDPRMLTEPDVVTILATYGPRPRGPAHGMMLRALKSFYRWATDIDVGEAMLDPTRRLRVPREKLTDAPTLSAAELEAVLSAAELVDPRARPALTLAYYTGGRAGSLVAVRDEDVRIDGDGVTWVHFLEAKGERPYKVPVTAPEGLEAIAQLRRLCDYAPLRGRRRDTLIGVGRSRLEQWAKAAGRLAVVSIQGKGVWPHLLRHTFATELAEADDYTFALLMNHRDASQRRRYAGPKDVRTIGAVGGLDRARA